MNIKEKWVAWEELLPGFTPATVVDFQQVGGLAPGSIPFADATGFLTQDNANLFWDETNARLGLNQPIPTARIDIIALAASNAPAINISAGVNGEMSTPTGEVFRWGHWDAGTTTFTTRLKFDAAGIFYISYLTTGSVILAGAGGEIKQDNANFFWDAANHWLALGHAAPAGLLDVSGVGTTFGWGGAYGGVVARFHCTQNKHTSIVIDAVAGKDPILGFAESGACIWAIRNDASATDEFQIRYHVGVANRIDFKIDNAGNVSIPTGALTLLNQGLHLLDTGGDHDLIIASGEDLGADRILTIILGNAARTITLSGNPTLADWFDQAVKQVSAPTFDDITVSNPVNIYALSHNAFADYAVAQHRVWEDSIAQDIHADNISEGSVTQHVGAIDHDALLNTHANPYKLDDLAAPDDNTDLDFSTTKHGLCPKGTDVGDFLRDDGTWAAGGGGGAFTDLTDTPANYAGSAGKVVAVNATPDALEFVDTLTLVGLIITDIFLENHGVDHNLFLGHLAGAGIQAGGQRNLFIGEGAGNAITTADNNVFMGYFAGNLCTAQNNVAIGAYAGRLMTGVTATGNTLVGYASGFTLTSGGSNMYLGTAAGFTNSIGGSNVAIGYNAGYKHTGSFGIFIGGSAGFNVTTGASNVLIGYQAAYLLSGGASNVYIGHAAGASCGTSGISNVVVGFYAGFQNEGSYNVLLGRDAGAAGTTQYDNVIIGYRAAYFNQTGDDNVIIGYMAAYGVGANSFANNTIVGHEAAKALTVGGTNAIFGKQAGLLLTAGSGNVFLGYLAGSQETVGSNKLYIANSNTATPLIYGEFPNALLKVQVTNFNVIGTCNLGDGGVTNYAEVKADGEINLHGTARVLNGQWIDAQAIKAPQTNPAELISFGLLETPAFQFADAIEANQENVTFNMRLPDRMDKGVAPFLSLGWSADGISPGDCRWQLEYLYTKLDDNTALGAQDTVLVTSTASATTNGMVMAIFPAMQLPEATDICVHCRVTRLSADGADTISDTVELHGLCLSFTIDRLGLAT